MITPNYCCPFELEFFKEIVALEVLQSLLFVDISGALQGIADVEQHGGEYDRTHLADSGEHVLQRRQDVPRRSHLHGAYLCREGRVAASQRRLCRYALNSCVSCW